MRSFPTLGNSRQNSSINNHLLFLPPHFSSNAWTKCFPQEQSCSPGQFSPRQDSIFQIIKSFKHIPYIASKILKNKQTNKQTKNLWLETTGYLSLKPGIFIRALGTSIALIVLVLQMWKLHSKCSWLLTASWQFIGNNSLLLKWPLLRLMKLRDFLSLGSLSLPTLK